MEYVGNELDLFRHATAWKAYYSSVLRPYVRGAVLEVGAGLGGTTPFLVNPAVRSYTAIEPDPDLCSRLSAELSGLGRDYQLSVSDRTVVNLSQDEKFDCITYIDVLEHIEGDRAELAVAAEHLSPGGVIAVLSPAFEVLRSPFDDAIGHWRRYTRRTLESVFPQDLEVVASRYFDALGAGLSFANRFLLKSDQPTVKQIQFWNEWVIPLSRALDPLLSRFWGRSALVIARKTPSETSLGSP